MRPAPPEHIQDAWQLYNMLESRTTRMWDLYERDFLLYYFPEVTGLPEAPTDEDYPEASQTEESDVEGFDSDDIPF